MARSLSGNAEICFGWVSTTRDRIHPDCVIGSGLRIGGLDVPNAADAVGEFLQGCGITHFLHGQHMRVHWGDRASQRG